MCGVAGWIGPTERRPRETVLSEMTVQLAHRGPDGEGVFVARTRDGAFGVGLGHRRLAIIDPRGGHQPMHDRSGRLTVVFNGEIYNFRELRRELAAEGHSFTTSGDTEVLLEGYRRWGADLVPRLRGMFAFALWDADAERLLLARDAFGKKPLFLLEREGVLYFASEIKSLLVVPGAPQAIDRAAVWEYLVYRYVPGPATLFDGIHKLPPATTLSWDRGTTARRSYFCAPDGAPPVPAELEDPVEAFLARLDHAVASRMVSDVPFGAFLSGGIDSSAVVGLMTRHSTERVATFSVGFTEQAYGELSHAAVIARHFQTDHHELAVSAGDLMQELPRLIRFRDAPVSEPSDVPIYRLACEAGKSVKMVLTGEGSDEVLAGYPKHAAEQWVSLYQAMVPRPVHDRLIEPLVLALPYRFRRIKTAAVNFGLRDPAERLPRWFGALSFAERERLSRLPSAAPAARRDPPFANGAANTALRRALYFDQTSWLPDNLLERGDRMTMAASIEARMPFLDQDLAALVSALPSRWRLRRGRTKWILREAMKRLLPVSILERPKVGFRVPVNEWFQHGMRDYLYDHLLGPSALTRDYYRPEVLRQLLDDHTRGRQNHEKLLWSLLNLELFHRVYFGRGSHP